MSKRVYLINLIQWRNREEIPKHNSSKRILLGFLKIIIQIRPNLQISHLIILDFHKIIIFSNNLNRIRNNLSQCKINFITNRINLINHNFL